MAFKLSIYPWVHNAHYDGKIWEEEYLEQPHLTPEEESALDEEAHLALTNRRSVLRLPR